MKPTKRFDHNASAAARKSRAEAGKAYHTGPARDQFNSRLSKHLRGSSEGAGGRVRRAHALGHVYIKVNWPRGQSRPSRRSPAPPARTIAAVGILAVLLTCGIAAPAQAQPEPWTLDRVLEVARRSDPGIAAARSAERAGRAAAATTWSALSPRIGVDGAWTRTDDPALLFSQKLWQGRFAADDFALPALNDPAPRNAWSWGITAEQPLWNGGAEVTAPALASHRSRAAHASARAAMADRLLEVARIYVEAVRAREALLGDSASLAAAEEGRRAASERFRRGQVPELDTLRAATRWAEARVQRFSSWRRFHVARSRLSVLLERAVGPDEVGVLPDPEPLHRAAASPRPDARSWAYESARAEASARALEATRASLALLPSLNARADVRRYEDPKSGVGERRFFVGLIASFPVWDGLRRLQERRAASARADEARAHAELLRRAHQTEQIDALLAATESLQRLDASRLAASSAEEALRLAQSRYRAGLLPQSDLLAVDAEVARARHLRADADADAVLAQIRLMHVRGVLE